ncbi:MAG: GAF domain-containing protein [Spirulinaceae cyanobacterium RM2_2_10]|nr:GAF domain-containing protein [Spirulinaceae cyanobacterium RM2_2_10]
MPELLTDRPSAVAIATPAATSYLLTAELEPASSQIRTANPQLRQLAHLDAKLAAGESCRLIDLLSDFDATAWTLLYHRHLLPHILQQFYGVTVASDRLQAEPTLATLLPYNGDSEPRYILFWLRLMAVELERRDPDHDELAGIDVAALLRENPPSQRLWEERIAWENYAVNGRLLWEGCDITSREIVQRLLHALIDPDGSFTGQRFAAVAAPLCQLFRADNVAIFEPQPRQWQVFSADGSVETWTWPVEIEFAASLAGQAAAADRVWSVGDLQQEEVIAAEHDWLAQGWRSLLLIPIHRTGTAELLGVVALASQQPQHFDQVDAEHATALIPGWRAALQQAHQKPFSRVHASVAWRFQQEAERRSLGLAPAPIAFDQVYPLYGISDICASSAQRNQAIQTDLVDQFQLALAAVDVALSDRANAFLQQLRLDLLAYIDRLQQSITAEDEVTAVQYLQQHFECYFDYFRRCGGDATAAADTYWQAVDNEHRCFYAARDRYDHMVQAVIQQLRETVGALAADDASHPAALLRS